jgi:hypothetical protein
MFPAATSREVHVFDFAFGRNLANFWCTFFVWTLGYKTASLPARVTNSLRLVASAIPWTLAGLFFAVHREALAPFFFLFRKPSFVANKRWNVQLERRCGYGTPFSTVDSRRLM